MKQSSNLKLSEAQLSSKNDQDTEHVEANIIVREKEVSKDELSKSLVERKNLYGIASLHNIDLSKDKVRVYVRVHRSLKEEKVSDLKLIRANYCQKKQKNNDLNLDNKPTNCCELLEFLWGAIPKSIQFDPVRHSVHIIKKKRTHIPKNETSRRNGDGKNHRGYKIVVTIEAIDSLIREGEIVPKKRTGRKRNKTVSIKRRKKTNGIKAPKSKQSKHNSAKTLISETEENHIQQVLLGRKRFLSQPRNLNDEFEKEASNQ